MRSSAVGLFCLFFFALSQGMRDAVFGNIFQSISFFQVALLAFGSSTIVFSALAALTRPADFRKLATHPARFLALNITTAAAWLSFFYGLTHLEPAVAATLFNGIGPITVLLLVALNLTEKTVRPSQAEMFCYLGIAVVLTALSVVTLTNHSGVPDTDFGKQAAALIVVALGGITITVSHMVARQFNDIGVGSNAVMGTRFLATLAIAAIMELTLEQTTGPQSPSALAMLILAAFALIAVPSFMLQLGIARASPLAVNVVRALGPVSVFGFQQLDGRLQFSGATLICVLSFSFFTIAASTFRATAEIRPAAEPA
jgi:drug/metabolite transporter (DMT)-like permease